MQRVYIMTYLGTLGGNILPSNCIHLPTMIIHDHLVGCSHHKLLRRMHLRFPSSNPCAKAITPINNPNWKERALGAPLTDAIAQRPTMRWNQVRMGAELAALCARTARDNNMSREGWMRQVLAEKISTIHGIPVDVLLVGMKPSRPRRTRHDGL